MSVTLKLLSAMEKPFLDDSMESFSPLTRASALRGEDYHFLLAISCEGDPLRCEGGALRCHSPLPVTFEMVGHVPVRYPCFPDFYDDHYLKTTPGQYPDLLTPIKVGDWVKVPGGHLYSVFATIHISEDTPAGDYTISVGLAPSSEEELLLGLPLHIVDALLPEQTISVTQWVHYDCIADAHGLDVFSEDHWRAIEAYLKTAVEHGINTILTPVLTPPLDTAVGGERPTVQLVDIEKRGDTYFFGYEKLRRFVALCEQLGVQKYEICHLFTQWGAYHAPKVMAMVDGEYTRMFGWETDSASPEYITFLRAFLTSLLKEIHALGIQDRVLFHISDEPNEEQRGQYQKVKNAIADILEGYPIYDAISDFSFYQERVADHPIPATNAITPFLDAGVKDLWTYYCCGQAKEVSNRFIAMSLARTRIIGMQLWKYQIKGFLHWGYNFYYTQFSKRKINPYLITDGDFFAPAGDAFSVYPAPGGTPYRSLRLVAFADGLCDMRALALAESLCGREKVLSTLEKFGTLTFSDYPRASETLLAMRDAIHALIEDHSSAR